MTSPRRNLRPPRWVEETVIWKVCRLAPPVGALLLSLVLPSLAPPQAHAAEPEASMEPSASASAIPSDPLFTALRRQAPRLDPEVLGRALDAMRCAVAAGEAERDEILTVIDYSLPSTKKRLWVFDVAQRKLLFRELVAHGKNTGGNMATRFSNVTGSLQTSLGLFRTAETYYGKNGYSLRLHGLEQGVNHLALPRTIVMHGAWYVSEKLARKQGRIGRSWGCPAVREAVARPLIDTIKNGSLIFAYYPDDQWLASSRFLDACSLRTPARTVAATAD